MKKIFTLILFVAAVAYIAKAQDNVKLVAKYAGTPPVTDGYLDGGGDDPWMEDGWVPQDAISSGSTTSDASAQFQLMHDDDYMYVAMSAQDATPYNDPDAIPNTYERDCCEIFFSMDTVDADAGAYQEGSWQIRIQREAADDEANPYMDAGTGNAAGTTSITDVMVFGENYGVETSSSEWSMEAAFPISVLVGDGNFDGEYIKFEIQTADNTTGAASGRTQQSFWLNNSDSEWNNTTTFSVVQLDPGSGVDQLTNTGKAFVRNQTLRVTNVSGVVNVYDLRGSVVRSAVINGSGSIDIADLKAGMYVVKGANLAAKIVK
jgi:hypothetical protein